VRMYQSILTSIVPFLFLSKNLIEREDSLDRVLA